MRLRRHPWLRRRGRLDGGLPAVAGEAAQHRPDPTPRLPTGLLPGRRGLGLLRTRRRSRRGTGRAGCSRLRCCWAPLPRQATSLRTRSRRRRRGGPALARAAARGPRARAGVRTRGGGPRPEPGQHPAATARPARPGGRRRTVPRRGQPTGRGLVVPTARHESRQPTLTRRALTRRTPPASRLPTGGRPRTSRRAAERPHPPGQGRTAPAELTLPVLPAAQRLRHPQTTQARTHRPLHRLRRLRGRLRHRVRRLRLPVPRQQHPARHRRPHTRRDPQTRRAGREPTAAARHPDRAPRRRGSRGERQRPGPRRDQRGRRGRGRLRGSLGRRLRARRWRGRHDRRLRGGHFAPIPAAAFCTA